MDFRMLAKISKCLMAWSDRCLCPVGGATNGGVHPYDMVLNEVCYIAVVW